MLASQFSLRVAEKAELGTHLLASFSRPVARFDFEDDAVPGLLSTQHAQSISIWHGRGPCVVSGVQEGRGHIYATKVLAVAGHK